jgi:hypothetical protein
VAPTHPSFAHDGISDLVAQVRGTATRAAIEMIEVDTVVSQNSLSPSADTVSDKTITVDQDFIDKVTAVLPANWRSPDNLKVGQVLSVPSFVYNTVSDSAVYANSYTVTYSNGVDPTTTLVLEWSSDKTQVSLTLDRTPASGTSDVLVLVNDTTTSTSAITRTVTSSDGLAVWQITLAPDTTSTASDAVLVSFSYLYTPTGSAVATISVVGTGTADDTGGTLTSVTTTGTSASEALESFDNQGVGDQPQVHKPGQGLESGPGPRGGALSPGQVRAFANHNVFVISDSSLAAGESLAVFSQEPSPLSAVDLSTATGFLGYGKSVASGQGILVLMRALTESTSVYVYVTSVHDSTTGTVDLTALATEPVALTVD